MRKMMVICVLTLACWTPARAQDAPRTVRASRIAEHIAIDGRLDEPVWSVAEPATGFLQVEPKEGALPAGQTLARVLTTAEALIIGIHCQDPDPSAIVSYSVRRDAALASEDHVRVVASYVQYDTDSDSPGTNTRFRWTFLPVADQRCAHENCHCIVVEGQGVSRGDKTCCSDHCATAGPASGSARCQCGHADCK